MGHHFFASLHYIIENNLSISIFNIFFGIVQHILIETIPQKLTSRLVSILQLIMLFLKLIILKQKSIALIFSSENPQCDWFAVITSIKMNFSLLRRPILEKFSCLIDIFNDSLKTSPIFEFLALLNQNLHIVTLNFEVFLMPPFTQFLTTLDPLPQHLHNLVYLHLPIIKESLNNWCAEFKALR